jgi:hypothetical protein
VLRVLDDVSCVSKVILFHHFLFDLPSPCLIFVFAQSSVFAAFGCFIVMKVKASVIVILTAQLILFPSCYWSMSDLCSPTAAVCSSLVCYFYANLNKVKKLCSWPTKSECLFASFLWIVNCVE